MRLTMITFAIETIAPKERSMPPPMTTTVCPTTTSISGTKSNRFPLSIPGWKKFGCR
jgi:hypothetical protein